MEQIKRIWKFISTAMAFVVAVTGFQTKLAPLKPVYAMLIHHWPYFWFRVGLACLVTLLIYLPELIVLFKPRVNVTLTPTSGNSPNIELRVTNNGKVRRFYVECEPLAVRFSPHTLGKKTAVLKWEGATDKRLTLEANESGQVEIATFELDAATDLGEVKLMSLKDAKSTPFEWSRWNLGNRENPPEYDIQVSVFADGSRHPKRQMFTVRPVHPYGPLEMVEVAS